MFLSGVNCYGVEANLLQCNDASVQYRSCPHTQDVGVYCAGITEVVTSLYCIIYIHVSYNSISLCGWHSQTGRWFQ